MNVLVAGGTGFVGRRLCETLAARGDIVTVVSRDPSGARTRALAGVSYRDANALLFFIVWPALTVGLVAIVAVQGLLLARARRIRR